MSRVFSAVAPLIVGLLIIEAGRGEKVSVAALASVASLLIALSK